MASDWQLAQMNIGRTVAPLSDARLFGFVSQLAAINALADGSPGFVWRLQGDNGNATAIPVDANDPLMIVNMSVWESLEALHDFVYRSAHLDLLRDRKQWFEKLSGPYYALWWVPRGHIPSVAEGLERIAHLGAHGPSEYAFWFGARFEPVQPGSNLGASDSER